MGWYDEIIRVPRPPSDPLRLHQRRILGQPITLPLPLRREHGPPPWHQRRFLAYKKRRQVNFRRSLSRFGHGRNRSRSKRGAAERFPRTWDKCSTVEQSAHRAIAFGFLLVLKFFFSVLAFPESYLSLSRGDRSHLNVDKN